MNNYIKKFERHFDDLERTNSLSDLNMWCIGVKNTLIVELDGSPIGNTVHENCVHIMSPISDPIRIGRCTRTPPDFKHSKEELFKILDKLEQMVGEYKTSDHYTRKIIDYILTPSVIKWCGGVISAIVIVLLLSFWL